jgi:AraC family transcriptional regulator
MEAEVREWLWAGDIRSNGPWMVLYYNPEYTEKDIEVEVAVSIEPAPGGTVPWPGNASGLTKVSGLTNVSQRTLVGVETMACVTHLSEQAGPADIYEAYTAFYQWTENNLFRLCGPVRELYLIEDRLTAQKPSERAGELIEVQFPVEPSALFRKETFMQPEIKTYPAFKVAGVRYHGKNENQEIAQMWDKELLPRFHEVKRVNSNEAFGVCGAEMDPDGSFTYVAGGQIKDPADVPPGMILYEVPEALYAVFPVKGAADKLGETYGYIYQSWLPQSGYKRAMTPDFEYYGPEFNGFAEDSVLYLYVPIQKA